MRANQLIVTDSHLEEHIFPFYYMCRIEQGMLSIFDPQDDPDSYIAVFNQGMWNRYKYTVGDV